MKVMISQPMNGVPDNYVKKIREDIIKQAKKMDIEIVESFDTTEVKDSKNPGVYYLGRTLANHMHNVDAVYFYGDWRGARGCRIEFAVCQEYGIKILPENFFEKPTPAPIMHKKEVEK